MPAAAEKINAQDLRLDAVSEAVGNNNKIREKRSKVHHLLDAFERQKLATSVTIRQYREAANADQDAEGLEGYYKWIRDRWQAANEQLNDLHRQIDAGIQQKIMSENDREFLMSNLILTDRADFIGQVEQIERILTDKIERMQKDHKAYDVIANNPLVKKGELAVDKTTRLKVPDETAFLKMTVPERRKWVRETQKALKKAKLFDQIEGKKASKDLEEKYKEKLGKLRSEKIIGRHTYDEMTEAFENAPISTKIEWLAEFDDYMNRYRELWMNIRNNLEGETLQELENLRDHPEYGYKEMFAEYKNVSDQEKKRLDQDYHQNLLKAQEEGIIGKETIRSFMEDEKGIKNQDLKTKYHYHREFENWMKLYRELWKGINSELKPRDKSFLKSKQDEWGYTELNNEFQRRKMGISNVVDFKTKKTKQLLGGIQSESLREDIKDAKQKLDARGREQKNIVIRLFERVYERRQNKNVTDFQSQLSAIRKGKKGEETKTPTRQFGKQANQVTQEEQFQSKVFTARADAAKEDARLDEELKEMKKEKGMRVVQEEGFQEASNMTGIQKKRVTRVSANRDKGVERLLKEEHKHRYGIEGGSEDEIIMAFDRKDGTTVDLKNLHEIRSALEYMKQDEMENEAPDEV